PPPDGARGARRRPRPRHSYTVRALPRTGTRPAVALRRGGRRRRTASADHREVRRLREEKRLQSRLRERVRIQGRLKRINLLWQGESLGRPSRMVEARTW